MSKNTLNSGSLQGLQMGQTLMVSARKVAGNKIQMELAEVLEKESAAVNPLAIFNGSDSRFSQGGARRAWLTAEPKDASKYLGIDVTDSNSNWRVDATGRELLDLNILNPVAIISGQSFALKVQVTETTVPTEYQENNLETAAKRKGKDGDFITHKGMYIFANTSVVFNKANHVFLESDAVAASTARTGILAGTSVDDSPFN